MKSDLAPLIAIDRWTRSDERQVGAALAVSRFRSVWIVLLLLLAKVSLASEGEVPPRLISLNPSLTAIVFRLGAGEMLVGVDDYSTKVVPEAADLPRVGGLFDPSLEAVVALKPDRVLIVSGIDQQSHAERLRHLGLQVDVYQNERLDQVLENIERLGGVVGREDEAQARIGSILATRAAVASVARGRGSPATLAVVDRSPLYVVGGETFLDEMMEVAGAKNLGRALADGYPRAAIEWLIGVRPELLLDMTPGSEDAEAFWSRWPSLPAVSRGRVITVEASRVSLPGPDLDRALRELAIAIHGHEIEAAIEAALAEVEGRGQPLVEGQGPEGDP